MKKVVIFGGGSGLSQLLKGKLLPLTEDNVDLIADAIWTVEANYIRHDSLKTADHGAVARNDGHVFRQIIDVMQAGGGDGFIKYITDDILEAVGSERDPDKACCLNVEHAVDRLKREFSLHPEVGEAVIEGAVYDIKTGVVRWL